MRAYMSEIRNEAARHVQHDARRLTSEFGDWAESMSEAERILADAEAPGHNEYFGPDDTLPHNERAVLAEGIAGAITALQDDACPHGISSGPCSYCEHEGHDPHESWAEWCPACSPEEMSR
jgi:hypothetical protein